jgi:Family of unknown function (DUF6262)
MPKGDGKEARIAALKSAAIAKQERSAHNFDKAISKLAQSNEPITFANVAREAGISISYIYKIPEAKERVLELRAQQRQAGKPNKPQVASDASKAVIIHELRERIKRLESEVKELRNVNQGMAGKLYQLQEFQSLAERLRSENESLKSQLENATAQPTLHQKAVESTNFMNMQSATTVTDLAAKRAIKSDGRVKNPTVSQQIREGLTELGIKLNSTLNKVILAAPESAVLNAIAALKQAITSCRIEHPGAWLKTAIENQWIPNEALAKQAKSVDTSEHSFREWYDLARAYGVITAFEERDGVMMVHEPGVGWHVYEEYVAKGWTIEYFRDWKKRRV